MMNRLLTLAEFAKELKKPTSTVRTWIRRGVLPSSIIKKIGTAIYIIEDKYNKWVDNDNDCEML